MSSQEEEIKSPTLRGSDNRNETPIDLSGAIPFMIDISAGNITIDTTNESSVNIKEYHFLGVNQDDEEDDEDDFYGGFFSGGTIMTPDYPSKEQMQAEEDVRAVLFKDLYNKYHRDDKVTIEMHNIMLNSPMFQNNDGFTAMNDLGLSIQTNIDSRNPAEQFDPKNLTSVGTEPAENFGIAAANDEAETTVDDFFPPPFIPFTM